MAAVEGAGVLPLELEVGLCDCSLVLSWVDDIVAGWEVMQAVCQGWISPLGAVLAVRYQSGDVLAPDWTSLDRCFG